MSLHIDKLDFFLFIHGYFELPERILYYNNSLSHFVLFFRLLAHAFEQLTNFFIPFTALQTQDTQFYTLLVQNLNADETSGLQKVEEEAKRKRAHYESKQIEKQGGNFICNIFI